MRTLLICMPVMATNMPSLGLSLLQAQLQQAGIHCRTKYFTFEFEQIVGADLYGAIADGAPFVHDLVGEWLFSEVFWGEDAQRDAGYLNDVLGLCPGPAVSPDTWASAVSLSRLSKARAKAREFIEWCLDQVDWTDFDVVGFSTTFQQNLASLTLAKRLKALHPELRIIFGGANCEGEMGEALLANFPFIDAVCDGEGDRAFPAWIKNLKRGVADEPIPGIHDRGASGQQARPDGSPPAPVCLDELPYPQFSDFLAQRRSTEPDVILPFETSRGCWWGQRSHCTFCGLNGGNMAHREKSPERAIQEIRWMLATYSDICSEFVSTDNIMPWRYMSSVLPMLTAAPGRQGIFYETKANLSESQLQTMHTAGVRRFQPGIESLATPVLKRMRKGITGIKNVQLLKFCRILGLSPSWNYLVGFPGETRQDYEGQLELIRAIVHFPPPVFFGPIRIDRFSPYFESAEAFGIRNLTPMKAYDYLYPGLLADERARVGYFFRGRYESLVDDVPAFQALQAATADWQRVAAAASLHFLDGGEGVSIFDGRFQEVPDVIQLGTLASAIVRRAARIVTVQQLTEALSTLASATAVQDEIARLREMGLIAMEAGQILALAIPLPLQAQASSSAPA